MSRRGLLAFAAVGAAAGVGLRVWALILFASYPREMWAPDYPCGFTEEDWRRDFDELERSVGDPTYFDRVAEELAPSADEESRQKPHNLRRCKSRAFAALQGCDRRGPRRSTAAASAEPRLWWSGKA